MYFISNVQMYGLHLEKWIENYAQFSYDTRLSWTNKSKDSVVILL